MPIDSEEVITVNDLRVLSPSESRVLDQALRGLSVREIADRLVVTEATVKTHLTHIYAKLGVRGRVDLLARVRQASASPPTVNPTDTGASLPPLPPDRRWILPAGLTVVAVLVLSVAALVVLAGGPHPTTLGAILTAVEDGRASEWRLDGDVLTAILPSGDQYRANGVRAEQVATVASENDVPFGHSPAAPPDGSLLYIFNLAGYALVLGAIWLWFRWGRKGSRRHRLAA